jgi:hypothetical protein
MNLLSLDIPEDPKDLAPWLEQRLLDPNLARLVTELSALQPAERQRRDIESADNVEELLSPWLPQVLQDGLGILPHATLRDLFQHPHLFAPLQEFILCQGGPYWDRVPCQALDSLIARGRQQLARHLQATAGQPSGKTLTEPKTEFFKPRSKWYERLWLVSLATAASVLVAVLLFQALRPAPGPAPLWGWSKPGALPPGASASEYLNALADAGGDWFNKRPEDGPGLARRIGDFRQGCSDLLFAEHRPLSAADRTWLVERCRAWAARLDQFRAALEDGADAAEIRQQADRLITDLTAALRARAKVS